MFFDLKTKIYELRQAVRRVDHSLKVPNNYFYKETEEIRIKYERRCMELYSKSSKCTYLNANRVESEVFEFAALWESIRGRLVWFISQQHLLADTNRKCYKLIVEKEQGLGNENRKYLEKRLYEMVNESMQALRSNVKRIEYFDYDNFEYKTPLQIESEINIMLNELYARNNQKIREARNKEEIKAKYEFDTLKKEYEQQQQADKKKLEQEKQRLQREFDQKVEKTVRERLKVKLEEEVKKLEERIKREFFANNKHTIEEEVNKRVNSSIKETLKRKGQIQEEELELVHIQHKKDIDKIETDYKKLIEKIENHHREVVKTLEDRINFLDTHLKQTIVKYESDFQNKYQEEIEARAKKLSQEYLKREFPLE